MPPSTRELDVELDIVVDGPHGAIPATAILGQDSHFLVVLEKGTYRALRPSPPTTTPTTTSTTTTCDNDGDRVGLPPRRLAGERVGVFRLDVVEAHPELPVAVHVAHEPA